MSIETEGARGAWCALLRAPSGFVVAKATRDAITPRLRSFSDPTVGAVSLRST